MIFNFVEYGRNLDLYAILDGVVLAAAITVLVLLFSYRRNLRVLVMLLSVAVLDILVQVLAGLCTTAASGASRGKRGPAATTNSARPPRRYSAPARIWRSRMSARS